FQSEKREWQRLMEELSTAEMRRRAGHQEVLGETLAKFEFFQHGWHPYSRFLDVDKIDLILRRRKGDVVDYREVQVKFGKLYDCVQKWERPLFSVSSWRFFTEENLASLTERRGLFLTCVLAPDDGFTDFSVIDETTAIDVTHYYRDFGRLG
ncbi:MAG: hypothetical protein KGJ28_14655, partial [Alphaproteobacteria bacterium]|nr:hypothetical protein [Alphaproteobacteria bacterium]